MERRKDNKGKVLRKGESQRADNTYMFRYKDLNGVRKSIYAKTLNELRKKEVEINRNLELGIYTNEYTLNQLFDRYIDANTKLKDRTRHKYKLEYERWVKNTWLGKKRIKDIVKSDIDLFYQDLKKKKNYSNGTIKCVHKYIYGSLEMAVEDDLLRKNCSRKSIEPYLKTESKKALSKEETDKFLTTAEEQTFGRMYLLAFKLMFLTGMRVGEVLGLTWDDVHLKERYVNIDHQFVLGDGDSRTEYHIDAPKTKSGIRKVPMSDDLYQLFVELKRDTYFRAYKYGVTLDGYSGFIIHTNSGLPVMTSRLNEYAKKVVAIYNENHEDQLPHITCHTCRHTFCTRLAEMGINPHALQKIAGHASYNTTARIYITVEDEYVDDEFFKVMRGIG